MLKEVKKCKTLNDYYLWYSKYYEYYTQEIINIINKPSTTIEAKKYGKYDDDSEYLIIRIKTKK